MRVEVWNDNQYPHREKFKGAEIVIDPGKHILMHEDEAVEFRGQYFPMEMDGNNNQVASSYKKIRLGKRFSEEDIEATRLAEIEQATLDALKCQKCGYKSNSSDDLKEHIKVNHPDAMLAVDTELDAQIARKRVGRPRKEE